MYFELLPRGFTYGGKPLGNSSKYMSMVAKDAPVFMDIKQTYSHANTPQKLNNDLESSPKTIHRTSYLEQLGLLTVYTPVSTNARVFIDCHRV